MLRLDRLLVTLVLAVAAITSTGCSRFTFIKPNMKKMKIEQVRQPVVARDSAEVQSRMNAHDNVMQASSALQAGEVAKAESLTRAALKIDPASVDAHTLMAVIAGRRGDSQAAGTWYKKAAELSGGRAAETGNYGAWLCGNERMVESLPYFDYAAENAGDDASRADALANAGTCAMRAGQAERAHAYLRQSLQYDAENRLALESLAALSLQRGQWLEARAFIERRLSLPPVTAGNLQTASQVETRLGDARAAARYQQRLRDEFPTPLPPTPGNPR